MTTPAAPAVRPTDRDYIDPVVGHPQRWVILPVLCLSLFLVVVDNTIVNVALPTLSRELSATTSQLQWIVDAYSLVFASLLLMFGNLGDRFGRKGMLQAGLLVFAGTSAFAAVATTASGLIAARAAMGIGAAMVFPATLAILTNVFVDPTERAKAVGIWAAVSGLAVALGPVSGGWLLEHFWWGSIFMVNLPIVAVALLAGWRLVPRTRDPDAGRLDPVGLVVSVAAVVLLVFTVIEAPRYGWASARTVGGFVGTALLLVGFVLWELRRDHPMLDVRVFRIARFSAASLSVAIAFFGLFGFIFLITQYFQFVRGYSTLSAGVHTLPFAVAAGVMAPVAARLAIRFGTKIVVTGGLLSMSAGFWIASTYTASTAYWGPVVLGMVFIAAGLTATTAPTTDAILGSLPKEKAGVGSAMNDTTRELGGTLGVAVVGSVFSSIYGPKLVELLGSLPIPAPALAAARESVQAAAVVAERAPAAARDTIIDATVTAFIDGLRAGTRVVAVATLLGALVAALFLPARVEVPDDPPLTTAP
ncbi:MAG: DHA2 family efflux MFS transporter permease subunit [Actinomycetes bacterium]